MSMTNKNSNLPMQSEALAWDEFVELTGISPNQLEELVDLGWFDSSLPGKMTFHDADIWRVRKLGRICGTFELPVIGGTIIVDLLERVDRLERLVRAMNNIED